MDKDELFNVMKLSNLFNKLDDDSVRAIVNQLEVEYYPENSTIIQQGDIADKAYFLLEGLAEAYVINKQGQEVVVGLLTKPSHFGEISSATGGLRTASVRAKTGCRLASLSHRNFENILDTYPAVCRAMNYILSERLSQTLHTISEKTKNILIILKCSEESEKRVRHFLKYLYQISDKSIFIFEEGISNDLFIKKYNDVENNYLIIKTRTMPSEFLANQADHIINFVESQPSQVCFTADTSPWKIENTVRKITNKTVGIALCSGGAAAAAHLGVLKVLQEENVPLDYIVGSSSGAIYGGGFAFNYSVEAMLKSLIKATKQPRFLVVMTHFNFRFSGILKNNYLRKLIQPMLGDKQFADAAIPFAAVASDLLTGKCVVINTGNVVEGIVASSAAPVIMQPVTYGDKLLIDGVATSPLPIQTLIDEGINIKIAVPISQFDLADAIKLNSKLLAVYMRSRSMMAQQITTLSTALADVIISPQTKGIKLNDWDKIHQAIEAGEVATRTAINRIRYLLEGHAYHSKHSK